MIWFFVWVSFLRKKKICKCIRFVFVLNNNSFTCKTINAVVVWQHLVHLVLAERYMPAKQINSSKKCSPRKKASTHIHIMEMENKYLGQINEMRRMHQTSIDIKRLVFFSSFGAISQYYECIIRFLLLCVMNWASRTEAFMNLCVWPNDDDTKIKTNDLAKNATRKKWRAKLKLIWKQSVRRYVCMHRFMDGIA